MHYFLILTIELTELTITSNRQIDMSLNLSFSDTTFNLVISSSAIDTSLVSAKFIPCDNLDKTPNRDAMVELKGFTGTLFIRHPSKTKALDERNDNHQESFAMLKTKDKFKDLDEDLDHIVISNGVKWVGRFTKYDRSIRFRDTSDITCKNHNKETNIFGVDRISGTKSEPNVTLGTSISSHNAAAMAKIPNLENLHSDLTEIGSSHSSNKDRLKSDQPTVHPDKRPMSTLSSRDDHNAAASNDLCDTNNASIIR